MAKMVPDKEYTDFHGSSAERVVYDLLQRELPDDYLVFHSEDWFRAPEQSKTDQARGEIDFLVCHPSRGLLILEVKGGGIGYEPRTDTWYTVNNEGRDDLDKNPAVQAEAAMYCMLERLKEHPGIEEKGSFSGVIGWGLFFADMDSSRGRELPDLKIPFERLLFDDDKENIQEEIERLYDYWDEQCHFTGPLKEGTWEALTKQFFRRELEILESLGHYIKQSERKLLRATERQKKLLRYLEKQRDVFIRGPAGSGKTLLALEKARRLAEAGKDVLWLCYNKKLREHVEASEAAGEFDVFHFHSFAIQLLREASLEFEFPNQKYEEDTSEHWQKFFDEDVPELLGSVSGWDKYSYDAIIIDEAQDFQDAWFLSLLDFFKDKEERWLYAFYDPYQSIFNELPDWLREHERNSFNLVENVRNTRDIGRVSLELGDIEDDIELGPEGRPVKVSLEADEKKLVDELRKAVHQLTHEDDVNPDDIVVLTRHTKKNSPLEDVSKLGNCRLVKSDSGGRGQILWSTIRSYKGLESDIVLLVIPRWEEEHALQWYTAASRAKHLLWIFTADKKLAERVNSG